MSKAPACPFPSADVIMSLCKDCNMGVTHEGEPKGTWTTINEVGAYVSVPNGTYSKDTVVLFLPDIFGPQLINNKLIVDDFAANGFWTVAIDYFSGDPAPADILNDPTWDVYEWLKSRGPEVARPLVAKVVQGLKSQGVSTFYATGYCYGGRLVFDLAFENTIQKGVVAHPSLLQIPEDLEKYFSTSRAPLLINSCENDYAFPAQSQAIADKILGSGKFAHGYKREYFEGCSHGFAVRGDMSNPKVKAGKEGSFKATVAWFKQ